jgi:hypothetical protein
VRIGRIEALLSRDPQSTPTASTVGKRQYEALCSTGKWNALRGQGEQVLTDEELSQAKIIREESELVKWFTPHLKKLVDAASLAIASPLVLVNTERHAWVEDPHRGALSKPDMLIAHPAFVRSNLTDGDAKYNGEGFIFGQCAHWDLRDAIEAIVEWKVDMGANDFSALGEGIDYARRIMHHMAEDEVPLDKARLGITRLLLADRKGFQLVSCRNGGASECVVGGWSDPGSRDAVVRFLGDSGQKRTWVNAIQGLSQHLSLTVTTPANDTCCFLGRGSCGRVFQFSSDGNPTKLALKVALGDIACSQIHEEKTKFETFLTQLKQAGKYVVTLSSYHVSGEREYAGILLHPVGTQLPRTQDAIIDAIKGLKSLATAGLCHGDARLPNVMWVNGNYATWFDFRTMSTTRSPEDTFIKDVTTFVESFRVQVDMPLVQDQAKLYFENDKTTSFDFNCPAGLVLLTVNGRK